MVAALGLAGISTAFSVLKMLQRRSDDTASKQSGAASDTAATGQNLPAGPTGPASFDPAALFAALDTDKSGGLDKSELLAGIQNARRGASQGTAGAFDTRTLGALLSVQEASQRSQRADKLLAKLDADGDGSVSATEFANGLSGGKPVDPKKDGLDALFAMMDKDKDGKVSADELKSAMESAKGGHHRHRHQDWTSLMTGAAASAAATTTDTAGATPTGTSAAA